MRRLAALRRELRAPPLPHCQRRLLSAAAAAAPEEYSEYDCTHVPRAWDFATDGGAYPLSRADDARSFFAAQGFVVFSDVMSASENAAAIAGLVDDLHEVNPDTRHITDPGTFPEHELPTSPNHTFRTTCNLAFGRFSWSVRGAGGVRQAFSEMHGEPAERLACSWDNPFYTPQADEVSNSQATQLHWDHNMYCAGEKAPLADELCIQGVYYAAPTSFATPAFVCCPGSHHLFHGLCESNCNPSKQGAPVLNYLPAAELGEDTLAEHGVVPPVQIHVPAGGLLLWDSRTCHGNTSPLLPDGNSAEPAARGEFEGRLAMAVCFGPTSQRTASVHKHGLLKGLAGIRTTHNPGIMLAHDKHGYPDDFVSNSEPNEKLRDLKIELNPAVSDAEFSSMIDRAELTSEEREGLLLKGEGKLSLETVQGLVYGSYWGLDGLKEGDYFDKLLKFEMADLRRLLHPQASLVQGVHEAEM